MFGHQSQDPVVRKSAVIPYRYGTAGLEVLLITSRRRKHWLIPKGYVEPDLTSEESAIKEALEEAGVSGTIRHGTVCTLTELKDGLMSTIEVFPMEVHAVHERWLEMEFRLRKWVLFRDLEHYIGGSRLFECVRKLPVAIATRSGDEH